jgi:probable phosphoglycerate mutase
MLPAALLNSPASGHRFSSTLVVTRCPSWRESGVGKQLINPSEVSVGAKRSVRVGSWSLFAAWGLYLCAPALALRATEASRGARAASLACSVAPQVRECPSSLLPGASRLRAHLGGLAAQVPDAPAGTTVVLLVRHAEDLEQGADPELSELGRRRVQELVGALASVRLTGVHSSPYQRTRETAGPVAAAHALAVQDYDPQQLPAFAARLRAAGGTHLVVGHSNTTPALVRALGGDPGTPIDESEHGRLYALTLSGAGVHTLLLHLPPP